MSLTMEQIAERLWRAIPGNVQPDLDAAEPELLRGWAKEQMLAQADAVLALLAEARAEERERCRRAVQLIAQEYESNGAAVGAFGTPREMAARRCYDAIVALADAPGEQVKP